MTLKNSRSVLGRRLEKVYLEVTNRCNLNCQTCIRTGWDIQSGRMSFDSYRQILRMIEKLEPRPGLFLGGYGEPLTHPRILEMVELAGVRGLHVELITNGTLLTAGAAAALAERGLDRLWISIDGASPESYATIRAGDYFPGIVQTLKRIQETGSPRPALGIALVLMRSNLEELSEIQRLCREIGADQLFVTHLEAYSPDMDRETLYRDQVIQPSRAQPARLTGRLRGLQSSPLLSRRSPARIRGGEAGKSLPVCPFIERGAVVVRWDGKVSPCLPLLYRHSTYLGSWERRSEPYHAGNIQEQTLGEIWEDPGYTALRQDLEAKAFSPCTSCRDCWFSDSNQQDCMGHGHPTCGGCLWGAGWIACP